MIRQKRSHFHDLTDEKLHEKLLLDDETITYNYEQKHFQPPTA